jgi:hypothetical protein
MHTLSDDRIRALIAERKAIPAHLLPVPTLPVRSNHERKDYKIVAPSGNEFVVFLRRSELNMNDFSVILGYQLPTIHEVFRLRRYNGKSHHHTNVLERQTFYDFHIHTATERYQSPGFKEDHFAEIRDRYHELHGAIQCLLEDCGFGSPLDNAPLFTGEPYTEQE